MSLCLEMGQSDVTSTWIFFLFTCNDTPGRKGPIFMTSKRDLFLGEVTEPLSFLLPS